MLKMNSKFIFTIKHYVICFLLFLPFTLNSQPVKIFNSAEIKLALKKLNVLGSVLYLGAHPDDENTEFLTYSSYEKLLRTGYLSLTRGDGGQNLIGDEQAELLGVIRTQELLQARKLDGADQFFSRAVDFGYTKSPEETFKFWDREKLLSDVVWIIRKFKPDVIVTRFPTTGEGRHGQHTASAILALEAFSLSGDPNAFINQLDYVDTWSPRRIYWNGWERAINNLKIDPDTLISNNLGSYNPLLGISYTEISARSRSMHKSQGFGDSGWRANYFNYFIHMDGDEAKEDLFEDIDISWDKIEGSSEVSKLLKRAEIEFDGENPEVIVPLLIEAYKKVSELEDKHWSYIKGREILTLIRACAGIWIEAVTKERIFTPGSKLTVNTGIVNRSDLPFVLEDVHITHQVKDSVLEKTLLKGEMTNIDKEVHLPDNVDLTQPYWLMEKQDTKMFTINDQLMIGLAEGRESLIAYFRVSIDGTNLVFSTPVQYRENDPTRGEVYNPIVIGPPVTANFESDLYLFSSDENRKISVTLRNFNDLITGELKLNLPGEWKIEPPATEFELTKRKEEKQFVFTITPPVEISSAEVSAEIIVDDKLYSSSSITINYDHIPIQTVFPKAKAKLVRLDIGDRVVRKIGYVEGSGDKIPDYLRELGFEVDILSDDFLSNGLLSNYDAIVSGIRAYNTNERMNVYQDKILEYIKNGGTYIVQYNTLGKRYSEPGPYEMKISRDRVTEEDSEVTFINPGHRILNFPNNITKQDFEGWIQERGLYFPDGWDENYEPILEMNDLGESPKRGSLLYAKYGSGVFIYTGLSFFREFPAGVPGAYRLFVNLISAGKIAE
jgi:LmbE family N-acetylglucosaminyl deacetylase